MQIHGHMLASVHLCVIVFGVVRAYVDYGVVNRRVIKLSLGLAREFLVIPSQVLNLLYCASFWCEACSKDSGAS
jgi:hypothetical protein